MTRSREEAIKWKEQLISDTEEKLTELTTSDKFKNYLKILSHFHNYSLDNINLIFSQDKNATMVSGFKSWQKLGRHVVKGSKAIYIKAPMIVKLTEEEKKELKTTKDKAIKGYKFVPVFDVKSTQGKELVTAHDFIKKDYTNAETEKLAEDRIPKVINEIERKYNVPITIKDLSDPGLGGYYDRNSHDITINGTLTKTEQLKVIFHEFAHSQLHSIEIAKEQGLPPVGHREAQAESIAYLTMQTLNIDTEGQALGYIATWAKDIDIMKEALSEIKEVFDKTYDIIEKTNPIENKQSQKQEKTEKRSLDLDRKESITQHDQGNDIQGSLKEIAESNDMKIEQSQEQERGL